MAEFHPLNNASFVCQLFLKHTGQGRDKRPYRKLKHFWHEPEADELTDRFIAEAIERVIVDHADGLHEGITNR